MPRNDQTPGETKAAKDREQKALFSLLTTRVRQIAREKSEPTYKSFIRWFAHMYFREPLQFIASDGPGDGKVDAFFSTHDVGSIRRHVINAKYTEAYGRLAPVSFYEELGRLATAFRARTKRADWLEHAVKPELRDHYEGLFKAYDEDKARITFLTTYRRNEDALAAQSLDRFDFFHLDDLLAFIADDAESAMPRTPDLVLHSILPGAVLSPDRSDTGDVPTAVVFARVVDFITYMKRDPADLLFARNVRLDLGRRKKLPKGAPLRVNEEIRQTFKEHPEEFAYSNNGITLLCEDWKSDASQGFTIQNPRVVNGSQTLHSVRETLKPSDYARVLVRVIKVSRVVGSESAVTLRGRRELIAKISTRSNVQNPIKKWNLIANDDYQQELARLFRGNQLFYQRRVGDWKKQRLGLREAGVREGPLVTTMMQVLASANLRHAELGPANAKNRLNSLFNEGAYKKLTSQAPREAFTTYLLYARLDQALASLARTKQWVDGLRRHGRLAMFSVLVRVLDQRSLSAGRRARIADAGDADGEWDAIALALAGFVRRTWQATRQTPAGKGLSINNFVKNPKYLRPMTQGGVPTDVGKAITKLIAIGRES